MTSNVIAPNRFIARLAAERGITREPSVEMAGIDHMVNAELEAEDARPQLTPLGQEALRRRTAACIAELRRVVFEAELLFDMDIAAISPSGRNTLTDIEYVGTTISELIG